MKFIGNSHEMKEALIKDIEASRQATDANKE